ncbi:MAG: hypothetical protein Q7T07_16250 [Burkholderiaceae bacterium]|nr:hypothetical protein [Burkholderiaceae bacterium]
MATLAPVLDAFPEWRSLVREEQADDGSSFEVLEVQAPVGANVKHGLLMDTAGDEITISFDAYHSHFDEWGSDGTHFGTMAALEFIKQLVSERVAVLSWWKGEQWCGSAQLEAGQTPEIPSWAGAPTITRIRVRSWKGTLNADVEV